MTNSLRPHRLQHIRLPCPSLSPGVCSNLCPSSQWCHPTISSSVTPFSSCPQSFPASGSFPISWLFTSSGQSIASSASASVFPMNMQGWFPLGLTGLISLLSKRLLTVSSSIIVQKHQFFGIQHPLWSNSHIHTWLLKKTIALTILTILWLYFVGKLIEREVLMDVWWWKTGVWWIHLLEQGIMSTQVQMLSNTCGGWHAAGLWTSHEE